MHDINIFSKLASIYGEESNLVGLAKAYDLTEVSILPKTVISVEDSTPIRDLLPFAFRTADKSQIVVLVNRGSLTFDPQNCNVEFIGGMLCRHLTHIPVFYGLAWVEGYIPYSGLGYYIQCPKEISSLSDIISMSTDTWISLSFTDKLKYVTEVNPELALTFSELYVVDRVLGAPQRTLSQYIFDSHSNLMLPIGFSQGLYQSETTATDSVYSSLDLQCHMKDYTHWEVEQFKQILTPQNIYIPGELFPNVAGADLLDNRLSQLGIHLELFR